MGFAASGIKKDGCCLPMLVLKSLTRLCPISRFCPTYVQPMSRLCPCPICDQHLSAKSNLWLYQIQCLSCWSLLSSFCHLTLNKLQEKWRTKFGQKWVVRGPWVMGLWPIYESEQRLDVTKLSVQYMLCKPIVVHVQPWSSVDQVWNWRGKISKSETNGDITKW